VSTIPGGETQKPVYFATAIDITARHRVEAELRRTATYLAEAEKLSHTGSWARDVKTSALFWSPEEWRIFGLEPATTKLTYEMLLGMVHPDDRSHFMEASRTAMRERRAYDVAFRVTKSDGSIRHIHTVGTPVFSDAGELTEYIGVSIDETDRMRANAAVQESQAELARVSRLTSMGELAASIAHEINQPLAAVVANSGAALRWLAHKPPNMKEANLALRRIVQEGNRASDVIERIRSFLRYRKPGYASFNLNEAIREVLGLIISTLRSREVGVQISLLDKLPPALGDRVQIQQVVMNLIMNAADAMASVTGRSRFLGVHTELQPDATIRIRVVDSGSGIDESIRDRIFDPLFTTKPTGMGMGLSICRSIVEFHGGRLTASHREPFGTEFQFTIPVAQVQTGGAG